MTMKPRNARTPFALLLLLLLGLVPADAGAGQKLIDIQVSGEGAEAVKKAVALGRLLIQAKKVDNASAAGRYAEALEHMEKLKQIASEMETELGDEIARDIPLSVAGVYAGMGMAEPCKAALNEYRRLTGGAKRDSERSAMHRVEAVLASNRGDNLGALQLLDLAEKELDAQAASSDRFGLVAVRLQVLLQLGDTREALSELVSFGKPHDLGKPSEAFIDVIAGRILAAEGYKEQARDRLQAALKVLKRKKMYTQMASAHLQLAQIYEEQGSRDLALEHWQKAGDYAGRGQSPSSFAAVYASEIPRLTDEGQFDEALQRCDRWLRSLQEMGTLERAYRVDVELYRAMVLVGAARYDEALRAIQAFQGRTDVVKRDESYARMLGLGLFAALELERMEIVQPWYGELSGLQERASLPDAPALQVYTSLGRAAEALGQPKDAERWYARAVWVGDASRLSAVGSAQERARIFKTYNAVIDRLVHFKSQRGEWLPAVAMMERGRARAVAEMMATEAGDEVILAGGERKRHQQLQREIEALHTSIERMALIDSMVTDQRALVYDASGPVNDPGLSPAQRELKELRSQLQQRVSERDALMSHARQQRSEAPQLATEAAVLEEDELAELPAEGEVLVIWHVTPEEAWVVAWDGEGSQGGALETDAASIEALVEGIRTLTSPRDPGEPVAARQALAAAWPTLLGPVADKVERAQRVVLIPHGPLHYLPFAALLRPDDSYLGTATRLSRAPSASILATLREDAGASLRLSPALVVGNPTLDLQAAESEARVVEALLSSVSSSAEVTALYRERAVEPSVLQGLAGAHTVLLSTHGVFWPEAPLESYIRLASSSKDPGRLTVAEISALDIAADLVFLSGCSTGLASAAEDSGELTHVRVLPQGSSGDDVQGLALSFLAGGATRVVGTLWDVADSSSELFVRAVFEALVDGAATDEALQRARSQLLEAPMDMGDGFDTSHPAFWAPFFLSGPGA